MDNQVVIKNRRTLQDVFRVITNELMKKEPFYGFFISTLNKVIIRKGHPLYKEISTAAVAPSTTSVNYMMYINEDFWWSLTEDLKAGILKHEVDHIIYFHPTMRKSFSHKELFNIAADLTINQNIKSIYDQSNIMSLKDYQDFCEIHKEEIKKGEITAPFRGCILEDFGFNAATEKNMGTQYYYDHLMEKAKDPNSKEGKLLKQMVDAQKSGNPTQDNHQVWKEFERSDKHQDDLMDQQVKNIVKEIFKNKKNREIGNIPGHIRSLIDQMLVVKKPVLDWKKVLRHFSSYSTEYYTKPSKRKLNKRIEEFSSIRLYTKKRVFVGLDTSGSMSDDDIRECFSEIHNIWKSGISVTVGECDAQLDRNKDIYEYQGKYPKNRKGIGGGGGTSCDPFVSYINDNLDKYTCFIYLTDGYLYDNKIPCKKPMLTVLTSSGEKLDRFRSIMKNFGKIVKMQPLT